jgi:hypothetical protein
MKPQEDQNPVMGCPARRAEKTNDITPAIVHTPEALYCPIVEVGATLYRWPEKALEPALGTCIGIGQAWRLHGAGLERRSGILSSQKLKFSEGRRAEGRWNASPRTTS